MKNENYDRQIGSVFSRGKSLSMDEQKKGERKFSKSFSIDANSMLSMQILQRLKHLKQFLAGGKALKTDMTINLQNSLLTVVGSYEKIKSGWVVPSLSPKAPATRIVHTLILAELIGHAGKYRKWELEDRLPDTTKDKASRAGLLTLSENLREINFYGRKDHGRMSSFIS